MNFIKKILNPKQIPFYKSKGNRKYTEILTFSVISNFEKYSVKQIIHEVHLNNETVVATLDNTLEYLYINKYGKIRVWNLKNTRFKKSTDKLFKRCEENISQILKLGITENNFLIRNGVRLTFLTDKGNYSIFGGFDDMEKTKIFGQTIAHFSNLTWLINPKRYKKIMSNEFNKTKNSR